MKFISTAIILMTGLSTANAWSAIVGKVTEAEKVAFQQLVLKDNEAKKRFQTIQFKANQALSKKPNPVKLIQATGLLNDDPRLIQTKKSLEDMGEIRELSYAYFYTRDKKYLNKAVEFMLAWARVNQPQDNAIAESNFDTLIKSYALIYDDVSKQDQQTINNWLKGKAEILSNGEVGRNNWQAHRIKIIGLVGHVTNDQKYWNKAISLFKTYMSQGFGSNGFSNDFEVRDALHYHMFSVLPLLDIACIAEKNTGEDLFDYVPVNHNTSLRKAVEVVIPYAEGQKKHTEFLNTRENFDKRRARSGDRNFIPHQWKQEKSVPMFAAAGCLDLKYYDLALKVNQQKGKYMSASSVFYYVKPNSDKNKFDNFKPIKKTP